MKHRLVSFDRTETVTADLRRPDRYRALTAAVGNGGFAARGGGLSYCMASAADGQTAIDMTRFNRVLGFDDTTGIIRVEAGATLGDIVRIGVPQGWLLPVLAGHPKITVGGSVAFDTHGKSQHDVGNFGDHIIELTLWHPDHGDIVCRPGENGDVFALTVGGLGLTGIIVDVTLQLVRLPEPTGGFPGIERKRRPVGSLVEAVEVMTAEAGEASMYSWHDLTRQGAKFGAGVVYVETHCVVDQPPTSRYRDLAAGRPARLPFALPINAIRRPTMQLANRAYRLLDDRMGTETGPVEDLAFPINGREFYFDGFGRAGFREYQFIVPVPSWPAVAERTASLIDRHDVTPSLGSLKLFSGVGPHLRFRTDGVCLAIDAPATPNALALFADLDRLVVDAGGRPNLAKDSRLPAAVVAATYPEYGVFCDGLAMFDPKRRVATALRERIDV